jgi:acyl-CoA dehydrogenase
MLTGMKAEIFASRALSLDLAVSIDMATATGDPGWTARAAFLTPIAKNYGAETGLSVADTGIQVHGGMGFIEETGAAQFARDVRVSRSTRARPASRGGPRGPQAVGWRGGGLRPARRGAGDRGARGQRRAVPNRRGAARHDPKLLAMELNDRLLRIGALCARLRADAGRALPPQGRLADPDGPRAKLAEVFLGRQMAAVPGLLTEAEQGRLRPLYPVAGRPGGVIRYPHEDAPAPGAAVEVAPGILWLRLPLPMALDHVNVYALKDEDGWTLSTPG